MQSKYKLINVSTNEAVCFGNSNAQSFGGPWGEVDLEGNPKYIWVENIPNINQIKQEKINELNQQCQITINNGFYSSAIGESHKYESKIEDQINLMGAVQMNVDMLYRCWNTEGTKQEWYQHTANQLEQVFIDGSIMVRQNLERVSILKEQVINCETIEEIESINW